jgi:hypothetical protein
VAIDSDTTIAILKATGAVAGGVLGIAGLLADFKNKEGVLTTAGRAVLFGIVLSSAIGVSDTIFEAYKAKSDSKSQAERTEHMLHEISRNLQPITELSASYWIEIPPGSKIVDSYIARLSKGIEDRMEALNAVSGKHQDDGLTVSMNDSDGTPLTVNITSKSDLWPKGEEEVIGDITAFFPLTITILKNPVSPETYAPVWQSKRQSLSALAIMPKSSVLTWDIKTRRLSIFATSEFYKSAWVSDGSIVSVLDLRGAQLILVTPNSSESSRAQLHNDQVWEGNMEMLDASLRLRALVLRFGGGRRMELSGKQFKKTKYAFGYPIFSLVFPKNDDEFETFSHSTSDDD